MPSLGGPHEGGSDRFNLLQLLLADAERPGRPPPIASVVIDEKYPRHHIPPSAPRRRPTAVPKPHRARQDVALLASGPPWRVARPARPASRGRRRTQRPEYDR